MSLAYPLVVAFSQPQLAAPVQERINAVQSALLYLNREGVSSCLSQLKPFLCHEFYQCVDPKNRFLKRDEALIPLGQSGLQKLDYLLSGKVAHIALNPEQQDVIRDLGFEVRANAPQAAAYTL